MQGDDDIDEQSGAGDNEEARAGEEVGNGEEAGDGQEEASQEDDVEARARRMGWRPQDEFRGPSGRFVDAGAYIERAETEVPIMRERLRKLDDDLAARDKRIDGLERTTKAQIVMGEKAQAQAVERAKAEMRAAVEEGDTAAFDKAEKAMETATEPLKEEVVDAQGQQRQPDPQFQGWKEANPWYGVDVEMTIYANQVGDVLRAADEIHGQAFYDAATEEMTKKFPDKFGNQRRKAAAPVGGGSGQRRGTAKGLRDMPAEDRKALLDQAESYGYENQEKKDFMAEAAVEYWKEDAA